MIAGRPNTVTGPAECVAGVVLLDPRLTTTDVPETEMIRMISESIWISRPAMSGAVAASLNV